MTTKSKNKVIRGLLPAPIQGPERMVRLKPGLTIRKLFHHKANKALMDRFVAFEVEVKGGERWVTPGEVKLGMVK